MKAAWQRHAARIDALALRERVFIFLAGLMLLAAAADTAWISPLWTEQKALRARLDHEAAEARQLRETLATRLGTTPAANDPLGGLRADLARAQATQATLQAEVAALVANPADVARLSELLEKVLRRQPGLTLVKLTVANDAAREATTTTHDGAKPTRALQRRGVDITLAGRYGDLMRDLAALETALPGLRWGALQLSAPHDAAATGDPAAAGDNPAARAQLNLRVYLVGAAT